MLAPLVDVVAPAPLGEVKVLALLVECQGADAARGG